MPAHWKSTTPNDTQSVYLAAIDFVTARIKLENLWHQIHVFPSSRWHSSPRKNSTRTEQFNGAEIVHRQSPCLTNARFTDDEHGVFVVWCWRTNTAWRAGSLRLLAVLQQHGGDQQVDITNNTAVRPACMCTSSSEEAVQLLVFFVGLVVGVGSDILHSCPHTGSCRIVETGRISRSRQVDHPYIAISKTASRVPEPPHKRKSTCSLTRTASSSARSAVAQTRRSPPCYCCVGRLIQDDLLRKDLVGYNVRPRASAYSPSGEYAQSAPYGGTSAQATAKESVSVCDDSDNFRQTAQTRHTSRPSTTGTVADNGKGEGLLENR
ncbi:hypothetical protein PybrP1_001362 [[Pythium] brassicae (nom. inval.)]|nr:hypothetical protein PybrP1_001362 [[Pythium] brassicae (nom. inval.)]